MPTTCTSSSISRSIRAFAVTDGDFYVNWSGRLPAVFTRDEAKDALRTFAPLASPGLPLYIEEVEVDLTEDGTVLAVRRAA
jgi:hypothetical protein